MAYSHPPTNQLPTSVRNHGHQPQISGNSIQIFGSRLMSIFNPHSATNLIPTAFDTERATTASTMAFDTEPTSPAAIPDTGTTVISFETPAPYDSIPGPLFQDADDDDDEIKKRIRNRWFPPTTSGLPTATAAVPTPEQSTIHGPNNLQEPTSSDSSDDDKNEVPLQQPTATANKRKIMSTRTKTPTAPSKNKRAAATPRTKKNNSKKPPVSTDNTAPIVPVPVTTPADDVVAPTEGIASGTQHHGTIRSTAQSVPKKKNKIQKGCRIFCLRSKLITFLQEDAQRACLPQDDPDGAMYYGTVTGGDTRRGYLVSMDILPDSKKIVLIKRGNIHVLDKDADEPKIDPKRLAAIEAALYESTDKRKSAETRSEEAFEKLDNDTLKNAVAYHCKYNEKEPPLTWKILGDDEYIQHDEKYNRLKEKSLPRFEGKIDFENKTVHENFFQHVWPDMTGSAAIVDEFLSNPQASYHHTYRTKNLKFHDPTNEDPDWKTKQCILALVAAASELENGMNCWLAAQGPGRKHYPDFGQFIPKDEMECFISCAAFIWADKKWWFCPRRDVDWDAFMPTVEKWNFTRTKLCVSWLLVLDESMSGWKPKTSKRGGLPNITHEPRKPVDLGTMFRNGAECHTGVLVHVDPVMCPERQSLKEYATTLSHLPKTSVSSSNVVSLLIIGMG
jgi:hypothetical protein